MTQPTQASTRSDTRPYSSENHKRFTRGASYVLGKEVRSDSQFQALEKRRSKINTGVEEMLLMLNNTYPMTSMGEVVETFLKGMETPMPDYIEIKDINAAWGGDGIESWTIYEIKDGNVDDGIREIVRRTVPFATIDGYKISARVILPVEEALSVLGKEMPAM